MVGLLNNLKYEVEVTGWIVVGRLAKGCGCLSRPSERMREGVGVVHEGRSQLVIHRRLLKVIFVTGKKFVRRTMKSCC